VALYATYSILSYHDGYLLFSSLFCYVYVFLKSYYKVNSTFRFGRYVTYYLM